MQYLCIHTFGPGAITREQIEQFSQMAQQAEDIQGLKSYVNLTEGKAVCIFEAGTKSQLEKFFRQMGMPVDTICPIEIEGERGQMRGIGDAPDEPEGLWPA